ncbi:MAG: tetratricopeptide repeat protein [Candidatus Solibacter sp.]
MPLSETHYESGLRAAEAGQWEEAVHHLRAATLAVPPGAAQLNSLGVALLAVGRPWRAAACFRRGLRLQLDDAVMLHHLGRALWQAGRKQSAVAAFERSVDFDGESASSRKSLASGLLELKQPRAALPHAQAAVDLDGADTEGLNLLAACLAKEIRLCDAALVCERSLSIDPAQHTVWSNLGGLLTDQGLMREGCQSYLKSAAISGMPALHSNLLLATHYAGFSPQQIFAEHCRWAATYYPTAAPALLAAEPVAAVFDNQRSTDRRLLIGYVSADFRDHSVAFLIEPVLAAHNRDRVEVFLYSATRTNDSVTARIQSYPGNWRLVAGVDNAAAAGMIRADRIDVLVDLSGHTAGQRLGIFAQRAAPVQATYCGYPDTTGLPSIDFRITDEYSDPTGATEHLHSERLWRIQPGFLTYRPPDGVPLVSPLPALRNGYVTFGCFAIRQKITGEMLAAWSGILRRVPNSRMILKNRQVADPQIAAAIRGHFTRHSIDAARIEFRPHTPRLDHLQHYADVDFMLDTFPYHGTVAACESLWMGVPVLTLAGSCHVSRAGVSLLTRIGLPQWIASSLDDYADRAVEFAGDCAELARVRRNLRGEFARSSLGDPLPVTTALEEAYRAMWRDWLSLTESYAPGRT